MEIKKIVKSTNYDEVYNTNGSSSNDTSTTSSSDASDSALKKVNRILRTSVARHWAYFRKNRSTLRDRGRSVSDAGLCSIVDHDPVLAYLDIPLTVPPRSRARLQCLLGNGSTIHRYASCDAPVFNITSAGGGSHVGLEEPSDGSDAERQKRGHHLRVPTPAFVGQSTGNFAAGAAGGGPRSAPATPLQLDPQPRHKHDKQAIKPLSGSAPSVRASSLGPGGEETKEGKQPSKARQKKFQRHFPQVGPEERVLNYYSCALVGDLLLQGHLYITKNYFAFYSNVFGYVTKLLIPTTSVLRVTKEKVARIIPNAVGVCTREERHVFGSLLSRDSTYKLMTHVWKASRAPELLLPSQAQDLRTSEVELDASEYSPEDDSSSAGGDRLDAAQPAVRREAEAIITSAGAAVIQPALLTGSSAPKRRTTHWHAILILTAVCLSCTALYLAYRVYLAKPQPPEDIGNLSGEQLYSELVRWRARLHGRAAGELHSFLNTNLQLLAKVRQSLEALSGVILTDVAANTGHVNVNIPADPVFS